jgi:hypothetical protein
VAIPPSDCRALTVHFISESDCAFAHLKLRRRVGDRGALRIFDSVLRMVCWSRNAMALQLVKQSGALQTKLAAASNWRAGKQPEFLYVPCLREWGLKSRAPMADSFRERWFKDVIISENDATRDVVLELSNVAIRFKSWLVAATTRTSTRVVRVLPTASNSRS